MRDTRTRVPSCTPPLKGQRSRVALGRSAPLAFSLSTERGRVLTRFSKDVDALDAALPAMLAQTLTCLAALLSALLAIIASSPLATPAVGLVAFSFARVVHRYRPSAVSAPWL
jgi:hypothetical protein